MSTRTFIQLFPELSALRKTVMEYQAEYMGVKANLDTKLSRMRPGISKGELRTLGPFLPAPGQTEILESLRTLAQQVSTYISMLDELIRVTASPGEVMDGNIVPGIIEITDLYFANAGQTIRYTLLTYGNLIPGSAGFSTARHVLDRTADLIAIGFNALFEALDYLPVYPRLPELLDTKLKYYGEAVLDLGTSNMDLSSLLEVIALWVQRWKTKPHLPDAICWWVRIAKIEMERFRIVDSYKDGDVLGRIKLRRGNIASIKNYAGRLPAGIDVQENGEIVVRNANRLVAGEYDGVILYGKTDEHLGYFVEVPVISLVADQEASFLVATPLAWSSLARGIVIAKPLDPDGRIRQAQIVGGHMPPGTRFNTEHGVLFYTDETRARAGQYSLMILTMDEFGGETEHRIDFHLLGDQEILPPGQTPAEPLGVMDFTPAVGLGITRVDTGGGGGNENPPPPPPPPPHGGTFYPQAGPPPLRNAVGDIYDVPPAVFMGIPSMMPLNSDVAFFKAGGEYFFTGQYVVYGALPPGISDSQPGRLICVTGSRLPQGIFEFTLFFKTTRLIGTEQMPETYQQLVRLEIV